MPRVPDLPRWLQGALLGGAGRSALFVVDTSALDPSGDNGTLGWLETQLGFAVTVVDDNASQTSDANDKALVVISSTSDSSAIGTKFTDVTVPVVTWEAMAYDDLKMTSASGCRVDSGQTELDLVDPAHPLAAGLSGRLTLYVSVEDIGSAAAESSAAVVATLVGDGSRAALFAYETGASMSGGFIAPARRVGLPFRDFGARDATEDAERLGLVAFCWAAGLYP